MLANAATAMAHGAEAAAAAEATARETFEQGGAGADLPTLDLATDEIGDGISIVQLFVRSGLAASGKEAKRLIGEGGARVNDEPVSEAGRMITVSDLAQPLKLSAGKKRHALVKLA